ncbi:MAG: hypothetical protein H9Q65_01595 [Spiroplasma ixodetis]|nr:hypothetical protein [Spiroplasma ixodetis]MBP1527939.1 hypothetical protein [Spiroplasma ixodetis]
MKLTSKNDKMKMIDIAIKPINEFIKSFFNELETNKKNDNNDIGKNILNINGSWGSGKSTIINNLEYYYQYKNDIEKPKFLIINLWEYETSSNPYYDLMEYIFYNICPDLFTETEESEEENKFKQYFFNLLKKIAPNKFLLTVTDHNSNVSYSAAAEWTKNNKNENINLSININNFIHELKNKIKDSKEKIVIIFDEIDRCTVDNQIIFLSYIKNIFFKITNIFFIVSSNNEVINQKLYIKNKKEYELENYTDKLFNSIFDLDIHFDVENLIFIENNEFIKQFLKEMDIKNPRLINKIIENLETIMKGKINKKNNNDFYSLIKKTNSKEFLNKIEFVIFYIYYLKFSKKKEYNNIFKFLNEIKIINSVFFTKMKEFIISKCDKKQEVLTLSNDNILKWILYEEKMRYGTMIRKPIDFFSNKITKYTCSCFDFNFIFPFFAEDLSKIDILDSIFIIEKQKMENNIYSTELNRCFLNLQKLNLQKHKIIFWEILTAQYYIKNIKNIQCGCITHSKINLSYKVIQEIMKLTIFSYSLNNHLNINNSEVKSEEIPIN